MTSRREQQPGPAYVRRLLERCDATPTRVVLVGTRRRMRADELAARVRHLAAQLRDLGAGPGQVVAMLLAANSLDLLVVRYAAHLTGAAVTSLRSVNPRTDEHALPLDQQRELVGRTGTSVLVTDPGHLSRAGRLVAGGAPTVIAVLRDPGGLEALAPGPRRAPDPDRLEDAVIAFTSGSTGPPKALRQSASTWDALVARFDAGTDSVLLVWTPLHHTVGSMIDAVLVAGGRVVVHDGFDAGRVCTTVESSGVTDMYVPTAHLPALAGAAAAHGGWDSVRRMIYSGTPAAPARLREALAVFGQALVQLYGSTEAGGISGLTPEDHREDDLLYTVGRPFPWVRVAVLEADRDEEVPRGSVGEVAVQGPTVMDGYLGAPRPAAEDWLRTGDLGSWDRYGYLVLTGRRNGVVKRGGLKILPRTVERALESHPLVGSAAVTSVEDADRVEHILAAVSPRGDERPTESALRAHVADHLGPESVPGAVLCYDELPLTAHGKADLPRIRADAGRRPDALEGQLVGGGS